MRFNRVVLLLILALCVSTFPVVGQELSSLVPSLVNKVPLRVSPAIGGSEFALRISGVDGPAREQMIEEQLLSGNVPDFLKSLKPVRLKGRSESGEPTVATIFVTPDYLAVGSNEDFLLTPMNLLTALRVAAKYGFILPTKKMVDAIFAQSDVHFMPEPMTAGPEMRSTGYYVTHDHKIKEQRRSLGATLACLVSGDKKDVVLCNRLLHNPGKIAIYGWHRPSGSPIQPLSTVHGERYADYSHGIRLVSNVVLIDDKPTSVYKVLEDPGLAALLSDEGTIRGIRQLLPDVDAR